MSKPVDYSQILKKVIYDATIHQPSLQPINLYPVCDLESGHFLVLATSRSKKSWFDSILFHARLITDNRDRQVIIEEDNFEEGLVNTLIEAGIKKEDIITSWQQAIAQM